MEIPPKTMTQLHQSKILIGSGGSGNFFKVVTKKFKLYKI